MRGRAQRVAVLAKITAGAFSGALALLQGCYSSKPIPSGFMLADHRGAPMNAVEITLLSDTQIHYLYGDPTFPRMELVDRLTDETQVAIRPVQLDYYARDLLAWNLQKAGSRPVVYLGDVADLSCRQELATFARVMGDHGQQWFLTPGNHDGYFYGHRQIDRARWDAACGKGLEPDNGAMNKADLIAAYLNALVGQTIVPDTPDWVDPEKAPAPGPRSKHDRECTPGPVPAGEDDPSSRQPVPAHLALASAMKEGGRLSDLSCRKPRSASTDPESGFPAEGCFDYTPTDPADRSLLRGLVWRIDRAEPWRSFVLHRLDLTTNQAARRVTALLLDTSAYDDEPNTVIGPGLNAGKTGDFLPEQVEIVHLWAQGAMATPGHVVVLMGHHPHKDLGKRALRDLEEIVDNYRVPLYVSAHTHAGFWKSHATEGTTWMELNVGSTTDWPPEHRNLNFLDAGGRLKVQSNLTRLSELKQDATGSEYTPCNGEWQAQPGDPEYDDYYLDYMLRGSSSAADTQHRLWDALLRSHRRLFSTVRTRAPNGEWPGGCPGCKSDAAIVARIEALLRSPGEAPADEKARFLASLDGFDHRRCVVDTSCDREFRRCQALWASQHEYLRDRRMEPHDNTVVFPHR